MIGQLFLGYTSATIDMPVLIELNSTLHEKHKYSEAAAHDISSTIYVAFNSLGELGPILGGYITYQKNFEYCCGFVSFLNFVYFISLAFLYRKDLIDKISELKAKSLDTSLSTESVFKTKFLNKSENSDLESSQGINNKNKFINNDINSTEMKNGKKNKTKTTTSLMYMIVISKDLDEEANKEKNKAWKRASIKYLSSINSKDGLNSDFSL